MHALLRQVADLLEEVEAARAAEGAGSGGTDAAWAQLLDGIKRIEALPDITPPAGAAAPRSLETLRLEARLPGCYKPGVGPLASSKACFNACGKF